jgi:hypothetical protein
VTAGRQPLAKTWHALTILVISASILTQFVLVIQGHGVLVRPDGRTAGLAERLLRFFSYFTIQSNLLAAETAVGLIACPDRDGRTWRVVRVAAIVGMTVTFIALGALSGWYPYPFIDVTKIGYRRTLLNALAVTVLLLIVGAVFRSLDTRRGGGSAQSLV